MVAVAPTTFCLDPTVLAAGVALTLPGLALPLEAKILLYGLLALLDLLSMLLRFALGVIFELVDVTGRRVLLSGGRPAVLPGRA